MPPSKAIYSLYEAAEIANCKPSDFLHEGAIGSISLLIGVPDGTILRLKAYGGRTITAEPALLRIPNLLVLRKEDCLAIELNGMVMASEFPLGYSYSSNTGLRALHPSDCDSQLPVIGADEVSWNDPRRRWTAWCLQGDGPTHKLEIVQERVLVLLNDVTQYHQFTSAEARVFNEDMRLGITQFGDDLYADKPLPSRQPVPSKSAASSSSNENNYKKLAGDIPGKIPKVTIGKLAVKAAWEIECEVNRKAAASEVISKLQEWVKIKSHEALVEVIPHGVSWMMMSTDTKKYASFEF
jgi:hypothetical protein